MNHMLWEMEIALENKRAKHRMRLEVRRDMRMHRLKSIKSFLRQVEDLQITPADTKDSIATSLIELHAKTEDDIADINDIEDDIADARLIYEFVKALEFVLNQQVAEMERLRAAKQKLETDGKADNQKIKKIEEASVCRMTRDHGSLVE